MNGTFAVPTARPLAPGQPSVHVRLLVSLILLGSLLAGCTAKDTPEPVVPVLPPTPVQQGALNNTTTLPTIPISLEFTGCQQLHTFFPYPIAMFQQLGFTLPDGFAYATEDGATVDVFLAWWFCPVGLLNDSVNAPFADVGSMFAAMPVLSPSDLSARDPVADAPQLELLPLTWILTSQLAANYLDALPGLTGGFVETGDVAITSTLNTGALESHGAQAHASFGTFDVDAAIQSTPMDNPAGRYRMWLVPEEGDVLSYLDIANSAGHTLGAGQADLRFQGSTDAGAPPATFGDSHVVDATNVVLRVVELRP